MTCSHTCDVQVCRDVVEVESNVWSPVVAFLVVELFAAWFNADKTRRGAAVFLDVRCHLVSHGVVHARAARDGACVRVLCSDLLLHLQSSTIIF